jgi:hypothetical protein
MRQQIVWSARWHSVGQLTATWTRSTKRRGNKILGAVHPAMLAITLCCSELFADQCTINWIGPRVEAGENTSTVAVRAGTRCLGV